MGGLGRGARDRSRRVRRGRRRAAGRGGRAARRAVGRRGRRARRGVGRGVPRARARGAGAGAAAAASGAGLVANVLPAARRGVPVRDRARARVPDVPGHGTVVVVSVAAFASGRPLVGAALLAPFGLARGLGPVLAFGVRSPSDGAALVERLERSASRARWRVANALGPRGGLAAMVVEIRTIDGPSELGALAAAALALTFGAAAVDEARAGSRVETDARDVPTPTRCLAGRGLRGPDRRARDRGARRRGARFDGGDRVARRAGGCSPRRS